MITKIIGNLYVGDCNYSKKDLEALEIEYVVNVGGVETGLENFHWHLNDGPNPYDNYVRVLREIDEAASRGVNVLVHCRSGYSRSPFIVAMYLSWKSNIPIEATINSVRKRHKITNIQPKMLNNYLEANQICCT